MTLLAMVLVGLGSYAFRVVPLVTLPKLTVSPRLERSMRHATTAAITALIVGSLAGARSSADLGASIVAVAVGLAVAMRGGPLLRGVAGGIGAYAAVMLGAAVLA
jgi:branched-subunit amino acid transport protein